MKRSAHRPVPWLVALCLAIGGFYLWTSASEWRDGWMGRDDRGYYNLLVRGFLKGHLYLDVQADPFLASLSNPWDPAARGNHGMPDTSYFRGHYYIYFGVAPAVVLFLPFRLLTGGFLCEALAPPLFACAGFGVSAWLLLAVWRRYFASVSAWIAAACVAALGLADMVPVMLRRPSFREVPIACGYACCMAAFACLYRSLHGRRRSAWLAAAGVAFGLAVGSRPLYLLACPVVLLPAWLEIRREGWRARGWMRLAAAAILPMALVGLGLGLYNFLRFGHVAEFGLRYQIWNEDPLKTTRFAWRFAVFNLWAYWLAPAGWDHYFPFVNLVWLPAAPKGFYGAEDPYGILPNMPFAALALGAIAFGLRRPSRFPGRLVIVVASIGWTAVVMSVAMVSFQAALNRYMVDFLPAVILLACLGLLALAARPRWGASCAAAACVLSAASCGFGLLASMRHDELFRINDARAYRRVAHAFNWLSYGYDRLRGIEYGPVEMKLVFPTDRPGHIQPLVVTGRSFLSDYLFVNYIGADAVQFGLEHTSRGTFLGPPVKCEPGRAHVIRVDLGSLYPPPEHPFFDAMSEGERLRRQRTARVALDGRVVFDAEVPFYEADGPSPSLGTAGDRPAFREAFSGRILSWRRLPRATVGPRFGSFGALHLGIVFPLFSGSRSEPLVCCGATGRGDLLYVHFEGPGRASFGYDHWGVGGPTSRTVAYDPAAVQSIDIDFGALHEPRDKGSPGQRQGRILLRVNGATVLDEPCFYYDCDPATVSLGLNPIHSSTAFPSFTGTIVSVERR